MSDIDEIKRLRRVVFFEGIIGSGWVNDPNGDHALVKWEAWEAEVKANGELERRIEELEKALKEVLNYRTEIIDLVLAGEHLKFVTHNQIDDAWATGDITYDQGISIRDIVEDCLAELDIVRCDECGGSGMVPRQKSCKCRPCNGHGWVKEDR